MRLKELLRYENIVIQCHDFPDADTIASGFGVYMYLKNNGKESSLIYGGKQTVTKPNLLRMIEALGIPLKYADKVDKPQVLVTVDCCFGEGNVTGFEAENIFVIDHHRLNGACKYPNEIRSSYSSCSTIVAQMLKDEGIDYNLDRNLATALYFGLYSDSNGMNEINHPADRDLRDLTEFDEITFTLLKNSNLSLEEMKIAGDALKHYKFNEEYRFAVVEAMPCDPNILGFISDLLLQVDKVDTCVVFCKKPFGTKLSVRSCVSAIRANEMAEFIVENQGSGGGHAQKAGGYLCPFEEGTDVSAFICDRMARYHTSYEIIHAAEYEIDATSMKRYSKKSIPLGVVKSTDILPDGSEMCIRTLEADLNVCAEGDLYIMVGINGEVYPIRREKFERSYVLSDAEFNPRTDYLPSVINKKNFTSINLMPFIKTCCASGTSFILAKELESTVKVYTSWDKNNYMLGKKGDYIAARCDDLHDIYVIEKSIFSETYEA